jgi:hypothetical protein
VTVRLVCSDSGAASTRASLDPVLAAWTRRLPVGQRTDIDNRLEAGFRMARYVGRVNGGDAAGAKLAEPDHRVGFG